MGRQFFRDKLGKSPVSGSPFLQASYRSGKGVLWEWGSHYLRSQEFPKRRPGKYGTEMLSVHQNAGSISFDHSAHDPFGASLLLQLEI